eukprot:CAMPEP_0180405376 /NCGR_PEP_ID=MMETSP0989-20121125/40567_1 /TAXON_ID=697907 /ORGANISM="non described non described, Strain CCMP2293" /LENGTH=32 /DNA_ID= /DNA_START= /DNA_END= /DNA_ORIENTATION=
MPADDAEIRPGAEADRGGFKDDHAATGASTNG